MKKPKLSKDFTVEDIHKLREYNAERRGKMSQEERFADIREKAKKCEKEINKHRKQKMAI